MQLDLFDETNQITLEQKEMIRSLIDFASSYMRLADDTELSIAFVDDKRIQKINREYRQKDQATDVISFALEDDVENELFLDLSGFEGDIPRNIGDVMISVEKTANQAKEYGHSFERELGFLALHGFLHLNGYDHMTIVEEKEMFDLQKEILDAYGLER